MKVAIVTGICCGIGRKIKSVLEGSDYLVIGWCRCQGVDLEKELPHLPETLDLFVHVSKVGSGVLERLLIKVGPKLKESAGTFVSLSSINVLDHDDGYSNSKKAQELIIGSRGWDFLPATVNCLRLGPIVADTLDGTPWQHPATNTDVAKAVMWFTENRWITSSIISLNRGC